VGGLGVTKKIDRSHGEKRRPHSLRRAPFEQQTTGPPVWQEIVGFSEELGPAIARSAHPSVFRVSPRKAAPCPQASLTRHAVRGSLRQSGMKLAIRLRLGAHWRLSAYRENRPCRLPAAERPRRDRRAARAHAKTPWARHIHFARGETPRPGLRRPGTFGRSPRVLGAIGMRPDRVDERFERSAANRSG
jgi:hypothetical protein